MSDEEKNEIKINLLEKEENNNKPSKNVKNFDLQSQAKFSEDNNSDKESIISKSKKSSKSYLDILMRPSFHRNVQNKYESNVPFISEQEAETEKKSQYDKRFTARFFVLWKVRKNQNANCRCCPKA